MRWLISRASAGSAETAAARRLRPPGLRDPRLLIGIVVMAVSVLGGAAALSGHDQARTALVLRHDVASGAALGADDLRPVKVDFADGADGDGYFLDGSVPPPGAHAMHPLGAGELLPRGAVLRGRPSASTEIPLSVGVDDLPATVGEGSVVDVWVVPEAARTQTHPRARLILAQVRIVRIGHGGDSLAPRATRQVIVGISSDEAGTDQQRSLSFALGGAASGRVLITRRG